MPCRVYDYAPSCSTQCREALDELTRLLCSLTKVIPREYVEKDELLKNWVAKHEEEDRRRLEQEKKDEAFRKQALEKEKKRKDERRKKKKEKEKAEYERLKAKFEGTE